MDEAEAAVMALPDRYPGYDMEYVRPFLETVFGELDGAGR